MCKPYSGQIFPLKKYIVPPESRVSPKEIFIFQPFIFRGKPAVSFKHGKMKSTLHEPIFSIKRI